MVAIRLRVSDFFVGVMRFWFHRCFSLKKRYWICFGLQNSIRGSTLHNSTCSQGRIRALPPFHQWQHEWLFHRLGSQCCRGTDGRAEKEWKVQTKKNKTQWQKASQQSACTQMIATTLERRHEMPLLRTAEHRRHGCKTPDPPTHPANEIRTYGYWRSTCATIFSKMNIQTDSHFRNLFIHFKSLWLAKNRILRNRKNKTYFDAHA